MIRYKVRISHVDFYPSGLYQQEAGDVWQPEYASLSGFISWSAYCVSNMAVFLLYSGENRTQSFCMRNATCLDVQTILYFLTLSYFALFAGYLMAVNRATKRHFGRNEPAGS
jgi:hypothetical protein